ncbi:MAG TPA: hypothetical protein VGO00_05890 [Kofleriaceae bacterium]|nr:hypothetical protein [Kofleriaceae bacterium]
MLGKRFQQEGIGSGLSGTAGRRQDAEHQYRDVRGAWVALELAAKSETVESWNEDLGDDDIGRRGARLGQCAITVFREQDRVSGAIEKMRLELSDMRIAIDDHDDRLRAATVDYVRVCGHETPTVLSIARSDVTHRTRCDEGNYVRVDGEFLVTDCVVLLDPDSLGERP